MIRKGPPAAQLRDAIAETMWSSLSALDVAQACDGLGMPTGTPGLDPMNSKRRYVRDRLMKLSGAALIDMARQVADDYGDDELATLSGRVQCEASMAR